MNQRLWINIGLLIFIVALSLVLLNSEDETKQELPRLSTIEPNDIVQIKILRKELDDLIFNKQDGIWRMNSPQQLRTSNSRINAMLRMLNVKSQGQLNPADIELKTIGLSESIVILKLNNHEIKFGTTDAIDQRRYILFNEEIHLVNDFLYHQLMTNAAFFASTKLLPEKTEIKSIQFPENKIELINDQWQLERLMDISPDHLKRMAFNWQHAAAISVSKYEAPEKEFFITLSINDGTSIKLVIVENESHLILGRKDLGIQYHMGSDQTEKLLLIEGVDINKETKFIGLELY